MLGNAQYQGHRKPGSKAVVLGRQILQCFKIEDIPELKYSCSNAEPITLHEFRLFRLVWTLLLHQKNCKATGSIPVRGHI